MNRKLITLLGLGAALLFAAPEAGAEVVVQCPGDLNGDSIPDQSIPGTNKANASYNPNVQCMHLAAGDGFVTMADGRTLYVFGFADMTGTMPEHVMMDGMLAANIPAPTITVDEGQELYLNLTNVGMMHRPDLADPHTVHWHGFPQAAPIFDGVPDASISINMGATLTYYYKVQQPGTYMYHCHVEATEHMQMGMLGNLYVNPAQNKLPDGTLLGSHVHHTGDHYAYNDGDGSTRFDVQVPLQLGGFDPEFHNASDTVQPLPFANMRDRYPLINGRGYPDTVKTGPLAAPPENGGRPSQTVSSLITATKGQRVLLRLSNLNVTRFHTIGTDAVPLTVIGHNARLLRGPTGKNLYYTTSSVTLGGGEALDAIIDTSTLAPGTYFLYSKNLYDLSNDSEDLGGMMTEIVILP